MAHGNFHHISHSGDITVTGKGHIHIALYDFPRDVFVFFRDKHHHHPCNPQGDDSLFFEIHYNNLVRGEYILLIKWEVSSTREIKWEIKY